jgi:hypothetical protein
MAGFERRNSLTGITIWRPLVRVEDRPGEEEMKLARIQKLKLLSYLVAGLALEPATECFFLLLRAARHPKMAMFDIPSPDLGHDRRRLKFMATYKN